MTQGATKATKATQYPPNVLKSQHKIREQIKEEKDIYKMKIEEIQSRLRWTVYLIRLREGLTSGGKTAIGGNTRFLSDNNL